MIDHISIGVSCVDEAAEFYAPVFAEIGVKELARMDGLVAYGRDRIEFLVMKPFDKAEATAGNGAHFAFVAEDENGVDSFHAAAMDAGAACEGEPGTRAYPHREVYAAYVRDPFGNKLEVLTNGFAG